MQAQNRRLMMKRIFYIVTIAQVVLSFSLFRKLAEKDTKIGSLIRSAQKIVGVDRPRKKKFGIF